MMETVEAKTPVLKTELNIELKTDIKTSHHNTTTTQPVIMLMERCDFFLPRLFYLCYVIYINKS